MAITMKAGGVPLELVCTDHQILAYLDGELFATIGTGTKGAESTIVLPGLDGTGFAAATSASDSDKLDGLEATAFLLAGGTAVSASDSDKLDGNHASVFSLANGTRAFTGTVSGAGAYFSGALSAVTFQYGTYAACAGASGIAAGYISILDGSGTTRFIPVWS